MHGLLVLFHKELTDHLKSARFLLMLALLTLTRRIAANLFF